LYIWSFNKLEQKTMLYHTCYPIDMTDIDLELEMGFNPNRAANLLVGKK